MYLFLSRTRRTRLCTVNCTSIELSEPFHSEKREKSYQCFLDDLQRCEQLGLLLYNFQ